jgi:hypothetical protein
VFRTFAVKQAEIAVNGTIDQLQFDSVSGWIEFGGANGNFVLRLAGGGGP